MRVKPLVRVSICLAAVIVGVGGLLAGASGIARAQDPILPPAGFGIASPTRTDSNGGIAVYGATGSDANWVISQWGNPRPELPAFTPNTPSSPSVQQQWSTASDSMAVAVQQMADGSFVETLAQSSGLIPCTTASGDPLEIDLLAEPNHDGFSTDLLTATATASSIPSLADAAAIPVTGTFQMTSASELPNASTCAVNQVTAGVLFILTNTYGKIPQVLYYTVHLNQFCGAHTPTWCHSLFHYYCWPGMLQNGAMLFAFDDNLEQFGQKTITDYNPHQIMLDVLPVLSKLIASGTNGSVPGTTANQTYNLDTNLSHWKITDMGFGQSTWGQMAMTTVWSGFLPTIVPTYRTFNSQPSSANLSSSHLSSANLSSAKWSHAHVRNASANHARAAAAPINPLPLACDLLASTRTDCRTGVSLSQTGF